MTKREAIRQSINHWKRMIAWAKLQSMQKILPISLMYQLMEEKLGECPSSENCTMCSMYYRPSFDYHPCFACPLRILGMGCTSYYSPYAKTTFYQKTWSLWASAAENEMLPALYSCFELCL